MYTDVYVYVRAYVCLSVCIYVRMHVYLCACLRVYCYFYSVPRNQRKALDVDRSNFHYLISLRHLSKRVISHMISVVACSRSLVNWYKGLQLRIDNGQRLCLLSDNYVYQQSGNTLTITCCYGVTLPAIIIIIGKIPISIIKQRISVIKI